MDSLDQVIKDMEEEINILESFCSKNAELKYVPKALTPYLTRLKALRENSNDKKEEDEKI